MNVFKANRPLEDAFAQSAKLLEEVNQSAASGDVERMKATMPLRDQLIRQLALQEQLEQQRTQSAAQDEIAAKLGEYVGNMIRISADSDLDEKVVVVPTAAAEEIEALRRRIDCGNDSYAELLTEHRQLQTDHRLQAKFTEELQANLTETLRAKEQLEINLRHAATDHEGNRQAYQALVKRNDDQQAALASLNEQNAEQLQQIKHLNSKNDQLLVELGEAREQQEHLQQQNDTINELRSQISAANQRHSDAMQAQHQRMSAELLAVHEDLHQADARIKLLEQQLKERNDALVQFKSMQGADANTIDVLHSDIEKYQQATAQHQALQLKADNEIANLKEDREKLRGQLLDADKTISNLNDTIERNAQVTGWRCVRCQGCSETIEQLTQSLKQQTKCAEEREGQLIEAQGHLAVQARQLELYTKDLKSAEETTATRIGNLQAANDRLTNQAAVYELQEAKTKQEMDQLKQRVLMTPRDGEEQQQVIIGLQSYIDLLIEQLNRNGLKPLARSTYHDTHRYHIKPGHRSATHHQPSMGCPVDSGLSVEPLATITWEEHVRSMRSMADQKLQHFQQKAQQRAHQEAQQKNQPNNQPGQVRDVPGSLRRHPMRRDAFDRLIEQDREWLEALVRPADRGPGSRYFHIIQLLLDAPLLYWAAPMHPTTPMALDWGAMGVDPLSR